ncbi:MAG TPA: hypothetical protein DEB39_01000, partial [Planctomycetaceae bacterium]|nr:hypothetical protein [Planctomycetaceae bacterium]
MDLLDVDTSQLTFHRFQATLREEDIVLGRTTRSITPIMRFSVPPGPSLVRARFVRFRHGRRRRSRFRRIPEQQLFVRLIQVDDGTEFNDGFLRVGPTQGDRFHVGAFRRGKRLELIFRKVAAFEGSFLVG